MFSGLLGANSNNLAAPSGTAPDQRQACVAPPEQNSWSSNLADLGNASLTLGATAVDTSRSYVTTLGRGFSNLAGSDVTGRGLRESQAATSGGSPVPRDDSPRRGWEVNLGPLAFGSEGIDLRPQLKAGLQVANFKAEAGLHDLRDGIKVNCQAQAAVDARASGNSLDEVNSSIHCDTPGFKEALEQVKALLGRARDSASSEVPAMAAKLGMDSAALEALFRYDKEFTAKRYGNALFELRVKANVSFGINAEARLGWCDTQGYHMVGIGGRAAAAVAVAFNIFVGRHSSENKIKIIVGISNFVFEYVVPTDFTVEPTAPAEIDLLL